MKRKIRKKILLVTNMMLALLMMAPLVNNNKLDTITSTMTTYAAELTQSARWVGSGDR